MLHGRIRLLGTDIGIGVGGGLVADQHRIALAVVLGSNGLGTHLDQAPVAIRRVASADALAHNRRARAGAQVDHLGAGIGLLAVVRESYGIKLTHRIGTLKHAAGVFPSNGRPGFHLGPANFAAGPTALPTLSHEIVDTTHTIFVTGVPVLNSGIFN